MTERESLIAWLEHRLSWGHLSIPISVGIFRRMWRDQFGDESGIPQELKDKAMKAYHEGRERAHV
jgi:hypothetical protein